jgi:hypothetical protein
MNIQAKDSAPSASSIKAVLLVEGQDEKDVVQHLMGMYALDGLHIEVLQGRGDLIGCVKRVAFDSKYRDVQRVGIVYDSEDDPAQAQSNLQEAGQYLAQLTHPKTAAVLQLPAPNKKGSFEALCLQAIDPSDPVLVCAHQYLDCLHDKPHQLSTQARKDKALLMAWYAASTGKNISRFGIDASGQKHFDYKHAAFAPLVQFIQELVR